MPKPRRTILSGIVTPRVADEAAPIQVDPPRRRQSATVQQTLYLPPPVHDQLRDLGFAERVKMHAIVLEGLDAVFRAKDRETDSTEPAEKRHDTRPRSRDGDHGGQRSHTNAHGNSGDGRTSG